MKNRSALHTYVPTVIYEGNSCSDVQFCLKLMTEFFEKHNTRKNAKAVEFRDQIDPSF